MNKTMEKEYKWRADELLLNRALLWASSRIGSQSRTIRMESSYFDTADGMLRNKKAALRLRRENERTVCCMKLRGEEESTDGLRAHEEYQCDAGTLEDGLRQLPEKGAPEALCGELLHAELKEICTLVVVTHNMQQAARISDSVAFFLLGELVEHAPTAQLFKKPTDSRTADYLTGRFG